MNSPYDPQQINSLQTRLETQQIELNTLLEKWATTDDSNLHHIKIQQEAMLALIEKMQQVDKEAPLTGLNLLADAEQNWNRDATLDWLFYKEYADLDSSRTALHSKLIGLISEQVAGILGKSGSKKAEARNLRDNVVKLALDGEKARRATEAINKFADEQESIWLKAKNKSKVAQMWLVIRDATQGMTDLTWLDLHETASTRYKENKGVSKRIVYAWAVVASIFVAAFILGLLVFVPDLQPSEQFCLVDSVSCQPATRQAEIDAIAARAVEEIAAAQGEIANTAGTATADAIQATANAIATQTREAELKLTLEAEATEAGATANAIAALTQEAVSADLTRIVDQGQDGIATQQAAVALAAEANATAQACLGANQFGFEIVSGPTISPSSWGTYVFTPTMTTLDRPLATVDLTIKNIGECSWGLPGFSTGLLDLNNNLAQWPASSVLLQRNGQNVGDEIQVATGEEADLIIYIRVEDSINKRFILVFTTTGGEITFTSQTIEVAAPNWAIPQTPTPTPTPTPTSTPTPMNTPEPPTPTIPPKPTIPPVDG